MIEGTPAFVGRVGVLFGIGIGGYGFFWDWSLLGRPGGDLLSHALRRSTIGAEGFHDRVRDGIGWFTLAMTTRPSKQSCLSVFRCGED